MPNSFFSFKKFTVNQDACAMKVCTDACLFGAWSTGIIKENTTQILDIGTGTGLLSLMLAQKTTAFIDAVEIDEKAFIQAVDNIKQSPWSDSIQLHQGSITDYITEKKYDLIISNPPFFENNLQSPDSIKNNAKHDTSLTLNQLLDSIVLHIKKGTGIALILLPFNRVNNFIEDARQKGLFLFSLLLMKQTPKHDYFRGVAVFSTSPSTEIKKLEITIKDETGGYSKEFKELLKDYYLAL